MNFEEYQNQLTYPYKMNFETKVPYVTPSGKKQIETIFDNESYLKAKSDYEKEETRIIRKFENDLKEELGITDNPKADLLISKAWDLGHSSGFSEVFNYAQDLVDLIL